MLGQEEAADNSRVVVIAETEGCKGAAGAEVVMRVSDEAKEMALWLTSFETS